MNATRREARERALELAYEREQRAVPIARILTDLPVTPDAYAVALVEGMEAHLGEIDALLTRFSEHWAVERMPVVDRTLLRLGAEELGWHPEVPTAVVLSETVELARQYSTKDSGRFVNGLLSRLAEELRAVPAAEG